MLNMIVKREYKTVKWKVQTIMRSKMIKNVLATMTVMWRTMNQIVMIVLETLMFVMFVMHHLSIKFFQKAKKALFSSVII